MKIFVVLAACALLCLCLFTSTSADTIALEKRAAPFPLERALTGLIQQEVEGLGTDVAEAKLRAVRAADDEQNPSEGGNTSIFGTIFGIIKSAFKTVVVALLYIPMVIARGIAGFANGVHSILESFSDMVKKL